MNNLKPLLIYFGTIFDTKKDIELFKFKATKYLKF